MDYDDYDNYDNYETERTEPLPFEKQQKFAAERAMMPEVRAMMAAMDREKLAARKRADTLKKMTEDLRGALDYQADDDSETLRHQARALDMAFRCFLMNAACSREQQIPLSLTAFKAQSQYRSAIATMKWLEQESERRRALSPAYIPLPDSWRQGVRNETPDISIDEQKTEEQSKQTIKKDDHEEY